MKSIIKRLAPAAAITGIAVGCQSAATNMFRAEQAATHVAFTTYVGYTNALANGVIHPSAQASNDVRTARLKLAASIQTAETWRSEYETNAAVEGVYLGALNAVVDNSSNFVYLINFLKQ